MKKLISDTAGYCIYADLRPCTKPEGSQQLRFITVWDDAKDPTAEQVKFEMILTPEQRALLKSIL